MIIHLRSAELTDFPAFVAHEWLQVAQLDIMSFVSVSEMRRKYSSTLQMAWDNLYSERKRQSLFRPGDHRGMDWGVHKPHRLSVSMSRYHPSSMPIVSSSCFDVTTTLGTKPSHDGLAICLLVSYLRSTGHHK